MRVLLAGAAMALLIASSAVAQTSGETAAPAPPSSCGALAEQPTLPDGATATRAQMDAANVSYTAWSTAYHANLQCRRAESDAARVVWQARVAEYNAAAASLNERNTAWEAEVAEFNSTNEAEQPERRGTRVR